MHQKASLIRKPKMDQRIFSRTLNLWNWEIQVETVVSLFTYFACDEKV